MYLEVVIGGAKWIFYIKMMTLYFHTELAVY